MAKSRLMHVFADESGDADHPGIVHYFAFLAVAFKDDSSKDAIQAAMRKLRHKWHKKGEVKFGKLSDTQLEDFFVAIGDLDFKHASCVFLKEGRKDKWLTKSYVYERVISSVVTGLAGYFREVEAGGDGPLHVHVTHDEHTDNRYLATIATEFKRPRARSGDPFVKLVRKGRSASTDLLQFVDVLCGAARFDTKAYRRFVSNQLLLRTELPEDESPKDEEVEGPEKGEGASQ